ncbi:MAG: hypothetical protein GY753_11440, partial [Gammaproteobacteria bacterium]|nr:hypothetical protein [Gammaproteobacteria bacterium]
LARSGRKPFRLAGLRLYADLLLLLSSLEISLSFLPDEPRLLCFSDAIRQALSTFETEYTTLAEAFSWLLDISDILDAPPPIAEAQLTESTLSSTVQAQLHAYLLQLQRRSDLDSTLTSFRQHLHNLTKRYAPGLFHCYDIPGLPRTNNDTESLFGRVRRQTLLTSGPYHARQRLHEQGAWLLFDIVPNLQEQVQCLQRTSLAEWRHERQRICSHLSTFSDGRRFRRHPLKYLTGLEAHA